MYVDTRGSTLAAALRRLRHAAALTQEELAERSRLSVRTISDMERGVSSTARRETLRRLAAALGMDERSTAELMAVGSGDRPVVADEPAPLPVEPIGRAAEIGSVVDLLKAGNCVVTVSGPGGVGKSTLARAVMRACPGDRYGRAAFVRLEHVHDSALVLGRVAEELGLADVDGTPLLDRIRRCAEAERVLVVLDNAEHLDGIAEIVEEIAATCSGIDLLVTSRARLGLARERLLPIAPLDPVAAAELFVRCARSAAPGWAPPPDADVVRRICEVCDRLPLAVELAAAWVRHLTVDEVLDRLSRSLPFLGRGSTDRPVRHRTIRDAIAWSVDRISDDAAAVLARLGTFSGGWDLDLAEALVDDPGTDVLDALADLADASLVQRTGDVHGRARYEMLGLVREFGAELLRAEGLEPAVRDRHLDLMVELVEELQRIEGGTRHREAAARFAGDHRNVIEALDWAVTAARTTAAHRIVGAMWWYWEKTGLLTEGRWWIDRVLALDPPDLIEQRALACKAAGNLARDQRDNDAARAHHGTALDLFRQLGARRDEALVLNNLANIDLDEMRSLAAETGYGQALAIFVELGDIRGAALVHNNLALALRQLGRLDEALAMADRSAHEYRVVGDPDSGCFAFETAGRVLDTMGDHGAALVRHLEGLRMRVDLGSPVTVSLEGVAHSLAGLGRFVDAALFLGCADGQRDEDGIRRDPEAMLTVGPTEELLRAGLGAAGAAAHRAAGRDTGIDALLELVRTR